MRIAPIDIAHKTFGRKMMGLDPDGVTDFLRDVADQMEEIIRERNALKEALREKDLHIMEFKERDETLKATITTATKMSEQIRNDAEREAKLIVNDAHQKAELIVKDARDSLKRIYQEIGDMKRSRIQFETSLRSLAQAHLAMLDQAHNLMPDPNLNANPYSANYGANPNYGVNFGAHPQAPPPPPSRATATPAPTTEFAARTGGIANDYHPQTSPIAASSGRDSQLGARDLTASAREATGLNVSNLNVPHGRGAQQTPQPQASRPPGSIKGT